MILGTGANRKGPLGSPEGVGVLYAQAESVFFVVSCVNSWSYCTMELTNELFVYVPCELNVIMSSLKSLFK